MTKIPDESAGCERDFLPSNGWLAVMGRDRRLV
jgi:hypothetical protein